MPSWEIGTTTTVFAEGWYHGTYMRVVSHALALTRSLCVQEPLTWNPNFLKYQHSCTFCASSTTNVITPISTSTTNTFDYATV